MTAIALGIAVKKNPIAIKAKPRSEERCSGAASSGKLHIAASLFRARWPPNKPLIKVRSTFGNLSLTYTLAIKITPTISNREPISWKPELHRFSMSR